MSAPKKNPMSLDGKSIVVTGAAQGLGRGFVELALDMGANVTAIDLNGELLETLKADLKNPQLQTLAGSVTDEQFVHGAMDEAIKRFGTLDGLINNAGIVRAAMVEKMTLKQWQEVIDTNLTGCFLCLQAAGRKMLERGKAGHATPGSIVNISSDAGRRGTIGQINYGAAKSGLLGLTMSSAREWSKFGVRINTVCFGVVETPMTETVRSGKLADVIRVQIPMGRWTTPAEAAQPVCFLLSEAASYITGQHISVNGGQHIGF